MGRQADHQEPAHRGARPEPRGLQGPGHRHDLPRGGAHTLQVSQIKYGG